MFLHGWQQILSLNHHFIRTNVFLVRFILVPLFPPNSNTYHHTGTSKNSAHTSHPYPFSPSSLLRLTIPLPPRLFGQTDCPFSTVPTVSHIRTTRLSYPGSNSVSDGGPKVQMSGRAANALTTIRPIAVYWPLSKAASGERQTKVRRTRRGRSGGTLR